VQESVTLLAARKVPGYVPGTTTQLKISAGST
jgi:hypothetical protein